MEVYISFILYICVLLGVGVYAYFSTKSFDDYVIGGRKMGGFVTAMSAGASDMSGWLLIGLPGAVYAAGLSQTWIVLGLCIGAFWNYRIVAGRLRIFTEKYGNAVTLPDFFYQRFPDQGKTLKIFSSLFIVFFYTVYCASGIVASANLFVNFLEVDYTTGMILGTVATLSYTFIGGYLAVTWNDTIQATLMIFALLLGPVIVLVNYGWTDLNNALAELSTTTEVPYSNFLFNVSGISIISALSWGLGYFGQPHILSKFMAADSLLSIKKARRIGITWMFLCLTGACTVGYFGLAYFTIQGVKFDNAEIIFIELAKSIFNPWVVGIVISAILAAIMSTLSTQLLISSACLTDDFYKGYFRKQASSNELVWVGRFMILVVAVISIVIASDPNAKVMQLVSYAWAGFGSAFGPVIIFALFSRSISGHASLLAIFVGTLTVVLWRPMNQYFGWGELGDIYEIVPGFIASSFVLMCGSLFSKVDPQVVAKFDETVEYYQRIKAGDHELEDLE